jgi:hypothetical protein
MQTSGARVLREDEQQDLSREAVLLQWERKIELAESRPSRFRRSAEHSEDVPEEPPPVDRLDPAPEDATHEAPRRFERRSPEPAGGGASLTPVAERRTITITGQPVPARRRRSLVESQLAQPDRIALWAFLLGLFLVAVAAGTAHA